MCIQSFACVGIGCNIISASYDGSIRQWRRDGRPVGGPWGSDGAGVGSLSVSVDETMVVSGSGDGRLRLWNINEGSMIGNPWEGHTATVETIDWSPNAQEVASGSKDGTMRRWNPRSGRQIASPVETGHGSVFAVKYSPEGEKLASGGTDNVIRLWSKDGDFLMETKGHEDWVNSLCWSKDGAYIFSASSDRTIRKWRSIDLEELVVLRGHTNGVTSLCLSPDERHLVSTSYAIRVWDLRTNQQVGDPLMHDDELWDIAISPDGKYVIGAGVNAKIYVWSLEAALMHRGGDRVHVRVQLLFPASSLTLFRVRKMERLTRGSRQVISTSLSHYISHLYQAHLAPSRLGDVRQSVANSLTCYLFICFDDPHLNSRSTRGTWQDMSVEFHPDLSRAVVNLTLIRAMTSGGIIQISPLASRLHLALVDAVYLIYCVSAPGLQMLPSRYHSSPAVGTLAYFMQGLPHAKSTLLLPAMKT
jgi:WD40 repeat protein